MTHSSLPTVYVVGDSTVCSFPAAGYQPKFGYGTRLSRYLAQGVAVKNLALSGRSSKSFLTEPQYAELCRSLSSGDYLVIGFGHNDEKREEERYTNANLPYTCADTSLGLSFAYNLYANYITLARDRGATPILCTPIVRLSESDDYSGVCGHITASAGGYEGGDYPAAIRRLGRDAGVTVIDLTRASMERYLRLGHASAARFHAYAATSGGRPVGLDGTHLNSFGAAWTAYDWACLLAESDCPLKNFLASPLLPPADEEYALAADPSYVEPVYRPFDDAAAAGLHFKLPAPLYGSVMGDFGGAEHVGEFEIYDRGDDIVVGNMSTVPRGKISSSADGFAAAFIRLPADANFRASAVCTVLGVGEEADGQSAFGMMLRDDIYADEYFPALSSNYVAAGSGGTFCRLNGKLCGCAPFAAAVGDTFTLSIERINQQIRARANDRSQSWYDFDLAAVDAQSDYLCLFAARHVLVMFSDIKFELTGKSVRA